MAEPIRIGTLDAPEATDLVEALAVRGLIGRTIVGGDGRWIEIHEHHEHTDRLLGEVTAAVETWLGEHDRESLEIRVGDRVQTVKAPSDIRDALRSRATLATRRDSKSR